MSGSAAPAKDLLPTKDRTDFGFNLDSIRFKLAQKNIRPNNNEKCGDQDLVARYPERYGTDYGDFHLEVQFADQAGEDTVNARVWVYGKDKTSAFCYVLADDGDWYIRTSEQAPRVKNGVNYWKLGEARPANKSDIEQLKSHFNSVAQKQKPA